MRDVSVKQEESVTDHNTSMDTDWSMHEASPRPEWNLQADAGNDSEPDTTHIKEEEASTLDTSVRDRTQASVTPTLPLPRSTISTQRLTATSQTTGTSALVSELAALDVNKAPTPADESFATDSSFTDACSALTVIPANTTTSTLAADKREVSSVRSANPHPTATRTMDSSRIPIFYMLTPVFGPPEQAEIEFGENEKMTRDEYLTHRKRYVLILLFAHFAKIL
jgi:hypothetical protein